MTDPGDIAVLRIELEDIEPLIWRRVAVPTSMNLKALHRVIQAAMGWLDYHLWEFAANEHKYDMLLPNDPDWSREAKLRRRGNGGGCPQWGAPETKHLKPPARKARHYGKLSPNNEKACGLTS